MDTKIIILIVFIIILFFVLVTVFASKIQSDDNKEEQLKKYRSEELRKYILKNSIALKELLLLNNSLDNMSEDVHIIKIFYDNVDYYNDVTFNDLLIYYLNDYQNRLSIYNDFNISTNNKIIYDNYLKKVNNIIKGRFNENNDEYNLDELEYYENKIFNESIKKFNDNVIIIKKYNTDLHDNILDWDMGGFNQIEIESIIKRIDNRSGNFYNDREIWDSICRVERSKVSNKLKFEIFERDNYRCKCCGTVHDGTNLEIDHIKPISKGGKSEPNNLQTLCHDCNYEKGNKEHRY